MDIQKAIQETSGFTNLDLLAKQVVEGFISGMHKSPFHGFSAEFAEHKIYNSGDSTKHIDWKLFAKTDKIYTKCYEEETNLRCHVILDNSSSMHYPKVQQYSLQSLNKISFSILAIACLMQMLKKQRDAVGLSIYSDHFEFYAPEKSSLKHHQFLLYQLNAVLSQKPIHSQTKTHHCLHLIAEKMHRRSLVFLFTDWFQQGIDREALFDAIQHLKHNKHEVVVFHMFDGEKELEFDFENQPTRFVDLETQTAIPLYAHQVQEAYKKSVSDYFYSLKMMCLQYGISYVAADCSKSFDAILAAYMLERNHFV